jgi:hypothetical protein
VADERDAHAPTIISVTGGRNVGRELSA